MVIEENEPPSTGTDINTRTVGENGRDDPSSNEDLAYEGRTWQESPVSPPPLDRQKQIHTKESNVREGSMSPKPSQNIRQVSSAVAGIPHTATAQRRESSGTPVSIKSKVSVCILLKNSIYKIKRLIF